MKARTVAIISLVAVFTTGCHIYGDAQIKPHHHVKVHKVIVQKAHTAPKPGVFHRHSANTYTKVVNHSHPGGGKPHHHNYGKAPVKQPAPQVILVKVVSGHGHHRHGGHHKKH